MTVPSAPVAVAVTPVGGSGAVNGTTVDAGLAFDEPALRFAYAALGAQRNTKIVGIFARLSRRDGKHGYLAHIPRIWRYLARDLAHPELGPLRAWYDRHLPVDIRGRVLSA